MVYYFDPPPPNFKKILTVIYQKAAFCAIIMNESNADCNINLSESQWGGGGVSKYNGGGEFYSKILTRGSPLCGSRYYMTPEFADSGSSIVYKKKAGAVSSL